MCHMVVSALLQKSHEKYTQPAQRQRPHSKDDREHHAAPSILYMGS